MTFSPRLAIAALAAGSLLSACASPVPVAPAPAAMAAGDDAAQPDRALSATSVATVPLSEEAQPAIIFGSAAAGFKEVADITLDGPIKLEAESSFLKGTGAAVGKPVMNAVSFTYAGYNPAFTRWFLLDGDKGATEATIVYRANPTAAPDVAYGFTKVFPTSYEVLAGDEGKLVTRMSFVAGTITAGARGAGSTINGKGIDFAAMKQITGPVNVPSRPTVVAGIPTSKLAAGVGETPSTVQDVGNATPGQLLKFDREASTMKGAGAVVGKIVPGASDFSIAGYNDMVSVLPIGMGTSIRGIKLAGLFGLGGKGAAEEVFKIEYEDNFVTGFELGNATKATFVSKMITISERPMDPKTGAVAKTWSTVTYDVARNVAK